MVKKTIMIVDDEIDTREVVKDLLNQENYNAVAAKDGADCLKKLEKDKIDLILLDIMMPGLPPKEIVKRIQKSRQKDVRIAYLTVVEFPEKEKEELLSQKNVVDYIQKPFKNDDLIRRVKKAVGD